MTHSRNRCTLCDSDRLAPMYDLKGLSIWRCEDCSLVFNAISLKPELDMGSYYSPSYYEERGEYYDDAAESKAHQDKMESFHAGLDMLDKYKPDHGRLLDVGCGLGAFLKLAQERGWEVSGIDISSHAASVASEKTGTRVIAGELKDAGFADTEFDAVSLCDAFEHFIDPNEQLRQILRILKHDGILFLNTPNQQALLRSVAHGIYRGSGGRISYPVRKLYHEFHLYYYSEANLRRMLEKHGFEAVEITRKTIPALKARGTRLERMIVRSFSYLERMLNKEYEILTVAKKKAPPPG